MDRILGHSVCERCVQDIVRAPIKDALEPFLPPVQSLQSPRDVKNTSESTTPIASEKIPQFKEKEHTEVNRWFDS